MAELAAASKGGIGSGLGGGLGSDLGSPAPRTMADPFNPHNISGPGGSRRRRRTLITRAASRSVGYTAQRRTPTGSRRIQGTAPSRLLSAMRRIGLRPTRAIAPSLIRTRQGSLQTASFSSSVRLLAALSLGREDCGRTRTRVAQVGLAQRASDRGGRTLTGTPVSLAREATSNQPMLPIDPECGSPIGTHQGPLPGPDQVALTRPTKSAESHGRVLGLRLAAGASMRFIQEARLFGHILKVDRCKQDRNGTQRLAQSRPERSWMML